jgi:RND family efflux transporter MFP subunit
MNTLFNRKNLIFVLLVLAGAGVAYFFLFRYYHQPVDETPVKADEAIPLDVVPIVSRTLFREDQLPGEIDAYQDVLIYPKVPGFVKWIGVDRGSVVKKGQSMVRMYAPEYLARRNEALARIAAAKADLAAEESRLQDLKAELKKRKANLLGDQSTYQRVYTASLVPGVVADNDVVQWSQSVQQDQQDVNTFIQRVNAKDHEVLMKNQEVAAEIKAFESFADFASYLEILAPFDGYVTERKMHVGSFVGPDGSGAYPPICRVKQLDLLRIVAPVPEVDAGGVVVGSQVQFSVSTFPGQRFIGTVARISNNLDKATRTMPVELNYFNPKYQILPGMFCEVFWPTRRRSKTYFVPTSAVVSTPLDTFVCRVRNNIVEWVTVRKGLTMAKQVEVFGDLSDGDLVAEQGNEELLAGTKITPHVLQPANLPPDEELPKIDSRVEGTKPGPDETSDTQSIKNNAVDPAKVKETDQAKDVDTEPATNK